MREVPVNCSAWYPVLHVVHVSGEEQVTQLGSSHTLTVHAPFVSDFRFAAQHLASPASPAPTTPPYSPKPFLHVLQPPGAAPKLQTSQLVSGHVCPCTAARSDSAARSVRVGIIFFMIFWISTSSFSISQRSNRVWSS